MTWHDDAKTRKRGGDAAEKNFAQQVRCYCGGQFTFIGDRRAGFPDFTCEECGQLVDVKSSPQAEQTGNIAVSFKPWQHYPDEMLLATYIHNEWIGQYKRFIYIEDVTPKDPTHQSAHAKFKNTQWLLISWKQFKTLVELGYRLADQPVKTRKTEIKRDHVPEPEARSHDIESKQMTFDW